MLAVLLSHTIIKQKAAMAVVRSTKDTIVAPWLGPRPEADMKVHHRGWKEAGGRGLRKLSGIVLDVRVYVVVELECRVHSIVHDENANEATVIRADTNSIAA